MHFVDVEVQERVTVRFALDPTDAIDPIAGWLIQGHPLSDPPIDIVLSLLEAAGPRSSLVDLGAHVGTITLPAAVLGHPVTAVEASRRNARLLRLAAADASLPVRVVHAYAGRATSDGAVEFLEYGPWGHRVLPDEAAQGIRGTGSVHTRSVDELMERFRLPMPAVVKIDVEGAEAEVLEGMRSLLSREDAPTVLIESNPVALLAHGSSPETILGILEELGYGLYLVDRHRTRSLIPWRSTDLQTECVADIVAAFDRPELPGWKVMGPLRLAAFVERILRSAADPIPGNRSHAARLIVSQPKLRARSELDLALRTLAADEDADVRAAATGAWS